MSSMWLTRCSIPDSEAVVPPTPVTIPRIARAVASRAQASGSARPTPADQSSIPSPHKASMSRRTGAKRLSMPIRAARNQSPGAEYIDISSPKPEALR